MPEVCYAMYDKFKIFEDKLEQVQNDVKSIKEYIDELKRLYDRGDKTGGHGFK